MSESVHCKRIFHIDCPHCIMYSSFLISLMLIVRAKIRCNVFLLVYFHVNPGTYLCILEM